MIQDGDREVRCARLTDCDVTTRSGDLWRQLADVERLDVEDASDELMASLTRHVAHLARLESLSVTWTPMKVVPGSWTRSLLPRLVSVSLTRNQLRSVDGIEGCGRLESLDLSSNLIDALPRHFGRCLPRLTTLVLTGNGLRSLPDSVGRLSQLRSLECAANKLTKLPSSVANLAELTVLDVSGNSLTALPDNIGQLGKLEHLRASGNKLTAVPASFARLGRLRCLLLSHNHLTHVPMELSALPALELFNAAGNEIAAVDCVLPSVRRLLLDDNRLTTIPRGVLRCHRLQVLSVERNLIRDVPDDIGQLEELTTLSLAGNDGVVRVPPSVGELARLRRLTLRSTRVRSLPSAVSDLRRRTMIDLDEDDDDETSASSGRPVATEHVAD